jgi:CDP-diglyceride synthetase
MQCTLAGGETLHTRVIFVFLALLALANGAPVLLNRILGPRWSYPVDRGLILPDSHPLFGSSKTLRGLIASVVITTISALILGIAWPLGVLVSALAMVGDLFSSFCKRRLHMVAGSRATGLDQIPEALFPAFACRGPLGLTALDIIAIVAIFLVGEMLLSIVFFKLHLRERPY